MHFSNSKWNKILHQHLLSKYWQTDIQALASCPKDAFKILLYIQMETLKLWYNKICIKLTACNKKRLLRCVILRKRENSHTSCLKYYLCNGFRYNLSSKIELWRKVRLSITASNVSHVPLYTAKGYGLIMSNHFLSKYTLTPLKNILSILCLAAICRMINIIKTTLNQIFEKELWNNLSLIFSQYNYAHPNQLVIYKQCSNN